MDWLRKKGRELSEFITGQVMKVSLKEDNSCHSLSTCPTQFHSNDMLYCTSLFLCKKKTVEENLGYDKLSPNIGNFVKIKSNLNANILLGILSYQPIQIGIPAWTTYPREKLRLKGVYIQSHQMKQTIHTHRTTKQSSHQKKHFSP